MDRRKVFEGFGLLPRGGEEVEAEGFDVGKIVRVLRFKAFGKERIAGEGVAKGTVAAVGFNEGLEGGGSNGFVGNRLMKEVSKYGFVTDN